jgi:hypothetical protein
MYDTAFFIDVVMPDLIEHITLRSCGKTLKGYVIHTDKASPCHVKSFQECVSAFKVERLPHPAHSPEIVPSEFLLFGHIKNVWLQLRELVSALEEDH